VGIAGLKGYGNGSDLGMGLHYAIDEKNVDQKFEL
jgi:hypothetical protein